MNNEEIFKPIDGYEGYYEISNLGKVKSLERYASYRDTFRKVCSRILKCKISVYGYPAVSLYKDRKMQTLVVHRLVASAFIPNPDNLPEVNHIDGNKLNNNIENLEWITHSENVKHAYKIGLQLPIRGELHKNAKLTNRQAKFIKGLLLFFPYKHNCYQKIADLFGVHKATIQSIAYNKSWVHI